MFNYVICYRCNDTTVCTIGYYNKTTAIKDFNVNIKIPLTALKVKLNLSIKANLTHANLINSTNEIMYSFNFI